MCLRFIDQHQQSHQKMSQNEIPFIHFFSFSAKSLSSSKLKCHPQYITSSDYFGNFISSISFQGLLQQYKHMSKPLQLTFVFFKWELLLYFILNIYYLSWFGWRVRSATLSWEPSFPKTKAWGYYLSWGTSFEIHLAFLKARIHIIYMILVIRKQLSDHVPLVKGTYLPCVNHSFPLLSESGKKILVRNIF